MKHVAAYMLCVLGGNKRCVSEFKAASLIWCRCTPKNGAAGLLLLKIILDAGEMSWIGVA